MNNDHPIVRLLRSIARRILSRARVVYRADSPVSGTLVVRDSGSERVLEIGGQVHSVYYRDGGWDSAIRDYWGLLSDPPFPLPPAPDVFMIGLGGATAARLIAGALRPSSIVVAETDPAIIRVARDYFGTGDIPRLRIVEGDGIAAMRDLSMNGRTFDYLIDDACFGIVTGSSDPGRALLDGLASISRPGATVALNRPVDRPADEAVNQGLAGELRAKGLRVEVRSVRGAGWNDVIYYRREAGG